eukprot:NODE_505_length_1667_cov_85.426452_g419_i0.p1 GENE.NODE_505_length_1667_cov_85.426452_g419_i0~~NODE_505_length_1667_cov_85.426452_g419_i0.p1  ORF type:complete len:222 (-),score=28.74 NODE_505_length_1667_cov_85.426452_g419_i0:671-1336(-)
MVVQFPGDKKVKKEKKHREEKKEHKCKRNTFDPQTTESEQETHKHKTPKKERDFGPIPPRKALKKLLKREMERQAPELFEQMMKAKDEGKECNLTDAVARHMNVTCDGCAMKDIVGIRYKCAVCKNFDYCELCEERLGHPHSFIKINKPGEEPSVLITGVHEEEAKNNPSNNDTEGCDPINFCPPWMRGRGGCFRGRGGRGGRGQLWRNPEFREMAKKFIN